MRATKKSNLRLIIRGLCLCLFLSCNKEKDFVMSKDTNNQLLFVENSVRKWEQSEGGMAPAVLRQEMRVLNHQSHLIEVCVYDLVIPSQFKMTSLPRSEKGYLCFTTQCPDTTIFNSWTVISSTPCDGCLEFLSSIRPQVSVVQK